MPASPWLVLVLPLVGCLPPLPEGTDRGDTDADSDSRPLVSYEAVVQLIGATTSTKGLTIRCELDEGTYEKGRTVSDEELNTIRMERWDFHGEWNYTLYPARGET